MTNLTIDYADLTPTGTETYGDGSPSSYYDTADLDGFTLLNQFRQNPQYGSITAKIASDYGYFYDGAGVIDQAAGGSGSLSLKLSADDGSNFALQSIRLDTLYQVSNAQVTFTGYRSDGSSVNLGTESLDQTQGLQSFSFAPEYVQSVIITSNFYNLQFNDVGLTTTPATLYWNGSTQTADGTVHGGAGSWTDTAANTDWTDSSGTSSDPWYGDEAIFSGTAGTVTVDDAVLFEAIDVQTDGYLIAAGTGSLTATGGATITTDSGVTATISTAIGGTAGLIKAGSGTLSLAADNTYTGGTTISAGTLQLDHATGMSIDAAGVGTISLANTTLEIASSGTLANTLSLAGTVATLAATNGTIATLTGPIEATAATLRFGSTTDTGTLVVSSTQGQIAAGTTLEIAGGTLQAGTAAFAALEAQVATVKIDADATLDLASYAATILALQGDTATTGGTLKNANSVTIDGGTFAGEIDGAGSATFALGTTTLAGQNGYAGATTITGTLDLAGRGSIAASGSVALATSGTFDISDLTDGGTSIVSLADTVAGQAGTVHLGANTLTLTNGAGTFSGTIDGTGGLVLSDGTETLTGVNSYTGGSVVSYGRLVELDTGGALSSVGAGTETLSGADTYTGGTTVSAGMLSLAHATATDGTGTIDAAGTGAIAIDGGALELAVSGTLADALDLGTGGTGATIGAAAGRTTTLTGALTLAAGTTTLAFGSATDIGTIVLASTSVTGTPTTLEIAGGTLKAALGSTAVAALTRNTGTTTQIDGGATLDLGGNSTIVASLAGTGTLTNTGTTSIRGGTFGGTIAGSGNMTFAGSTTLSGANTYTGTTRIGGGVTLALAATAALDATSQIIDFGTLSLAGNDLEAASLTGSGKVAGSGTIGATVGGTLAYAIAQGGSLTFTGTSNRFAGALGGTGATSAIFASGTDLLLKGTTLSVALDLAGAAVTIGASLNSSYALDLAAGSLALGSNTLTIFGGLDLSGGSIAASSGSLVLRGTSTFEGNVTIAARIANAATAEQTGVTTLTFQGPGSLANATGATYDLTGDGAIVLGTRALGNAGTFEKTGGTGTSTITGAVTNSLGGLVEATSGTLAVTGTVLNSGTVEATSGSTVDLMGAVGGRGTLDVEADSILELGAMIGSAQTAQFGSDGGTLALDAPGAFKGTIAGFGGSDTIDVAGLSEFTSVLFKANAGDTGGTLTLADASHSVALRFSGQYTSANFVGGANGEVHYQGAAGAPA